MRLFTAIDISDDVRHQLGVLLDRLRPLAKLSWTMPDSMHITTKFIGEWPEERLEEMKRALSSVGSPGAFEVGIRDLGWFPNPRHPRVLWSGVHGGAALEALAHATEEAVHSIGVPREERKYSPHLTLARASANRCRSPPSARASTRSNRPTSAPSARPLFISTCRAPDAILNSPISFSLNSWAD